LTEMRCDHLDAVAVRQISVQSIDQPCREGVEEDVPEDASKSWLSCGVVSFVAGERKTVIIGESDDFRPFAVWWVRPRGPLSCLAPVKEASMKASSSFSFPPACNSSSSAQDGLPTCLPAPNAGRGDDRSGMADICWATRAAVPQHPQNSVEHGSRVLPRTTATVRAPLRPQERFDQFPMGCLDNTPIQPIRLMDFWVCKKTPRKMELANPKQVYIAQNASVLGICY
jgi:hypothetical protein